MSKGRDFWVHILDESWQLSALQPDTRRALSFESWTKILLPAQLSHALLAYMLLQGRSRAARAAFLPVVLLLLYRSSVILNVSCVEGNNAVCDPALAWRNQGHLLNNFFSALQAIMWAAELRRPIRLDGTLPSLLEFTSSLRAMDMKGVGSQCHRPKEWRPTHSRAAFCLATAVSLLLNVLVFDTLQTYIHYLDPENHGFGRHGSLLPPNRLPSLLSTYITGVGAIVVYSVIQALFDMGTLIGVSILHHDPQRWPPLFDKPWLSTSLSDFWGRRWHQIFRLCFIKATAVLPLLRPLAILATFAVSGLLHLFGGWGMGYGESVVRMVGFFVMNGVGILLERGVLKHFFRAQSNGKKRVGGIWGWLWTASWLLLWGNFFMDACARNGMFGSRFFPMGWRPVEILGIVDSAGVQSGSRSCLCQCSFPTVSSVNTRIFRNCPRGFRRSPCRLHHRWCYSLHWLALLSLSSPSSLS